MRMGVADEVAHEIAGAVLEVTAAWRDYMTDAGLAASDLALLERDRDWLKPEMDRKPGTKSTGLVRQNRNFRITVTAHIPVFQRSV